MSLLSSWSPWRWLAATALLVALSSPARALPVFAREYKVGCETCHTVPPRLNQFGLAFQANHFNFPTGAAPQKAGWLQRFPVSGIGVASLDDNRSTRSTTTEFRTLDLFLSDGFEFTGGRPGGYFIDAVAVNTAVGVRDGGLHDAFVAVPVAGKQGQLAFTIGQFSPITYQYELTNTLTSTLPSALSMPLFLARSSGGSGGGGGYVRPQLSTAALSLNGVADTFSLITPMPGMRVDYFDHRGSASPNGNYVEAGVPFEGQLSFDSNADLGHGLGMYVHAFHRTGYTTYGVFGYTEAGNHLEGVILTHQPIKNLFLMAIGANGHDRMSGTGRGTLEAEWVANPRVAVTARLDILSGASDQVGPVAAVTFYPLPTRYLRMSGEIHEFKGDRQLFLFARGQF